ncbi:hypothetical protein [Enhygromyxa salina]|uniref:hypothetical protein n=1 Tax=Enhygromyxa salina TaxID=215803 RepID=UPI00069686AD|nr:hypothetical protein [Enhygromyxa salina]
MCRSRGPALGRILEHDEWVEAELEQLGRREVPQRGEAQHGVGLDVEQSDRRRAHEPFARLDPTLQQRRECFDPNRNMTQVDGAAP